MYYSGYENGVDGAQLLINGELSFKEVQYCSIIAHLKWSLNTERAYKKAPSSTLLASILKSCVRVTVVKEKSSANFAF